VRLCRTASNATQAFTAALSATPLLVALELVPASQGFTVRPGTHTQHPYIVSAAPLEVHALGVPPCQFLYQQGPTPMPMLLPPPPVPLQWAGTVHQDPETLRLEASVTLGTVAQGGPRIRSFVPRARLERTALQGVLLPTV